MPGRILAPAIFFVAGVLAADRLGPPAAVALLCGGCGLAMLTGTWLLHRRRPPERTGDLLPRLSAPAIALLLAGSAAVAFADLGLRAAALHRARAWAGGRVVSVEGKVVGDPEPAGRANRFPLAALQIDGGTVGGRLSVRAFGVAPSLRLGDRIRLRARIRALDLDDPFDLRLFRRGIGGEAAVSSSEIRLVSRTSNPILRAANRLRDRMQRLALESLGRSDAGLLLGLVIGDERLIPKGVEEDFRATGLSHLTAVSGANVAIVLGAVVLLLRALRVSRRVQVAAGLATIAFFSIVTRWEPSVLRAGLMAVLALGAFFFGRRSDPRHALGLAFVGLLAFDPFLLWSVGFQLSFAATAGILIVTPQLLSRLRRFPRPVAEALAVGVGAQAAVTPLLALHFGRLSLVAIPANLAAFALVAPITVLGLVGAVVGMVWPPPGRLVFEAAGVLVSWLRAIARLFASVPHASIAVDEWGPVHLLVAYLAIGAAVMWLAGRGRAARMPAAGAAAIGLIVLLAPAAGSSTPGNLRLTFLDVGQGDAALVETPGGARVLVDGGADGGRLARLLSRRGIRRIDLVVFSHAHADHVAGLGRVLDRVEVRSAVHPGVPVPLLARMGVGDRLRPAGDGDRLAIGDLTVDVLGPDRPLLDRAAAEAASSESSEGSALNDASLVLRLSWGRACALFTGDVEEEGQQQLVERHPSAVVCSILKAPHHGSARVLPEFVEAVDPRWVVVSVGRNTFGHPTRRALQLFERSGARVLRTDRLGDVVLEADRGGEVVLSG